MGFLKSSIYFCWHTIMGKLKEERSGSVRRLTYARLPAWWLAGRWRKTASRGAEKDFWVEERAMMGASRRGASAVPDSRNVRVAARASNKKRAYGWMDGSTTGYGSAASWSQCTCAVGGRVYIFDEKVFFGVHRERNSDRISAKFVKNRSSCNFKFKKTKFAFLDRISVISRRNSVISHRETYLPNGKVKNLAWLRNIQRNIYIDILQ